MIIYIVIDTDNIVVDVFNNKEDALNLANTDLYYYLVKKEVKMQSQKCQDCEHFSCGTQPDGIGWENCDLNYHCSVPLDNMFERKEKL